VLINLLDNCSDGGHLKVHELIHWVLSGVVLLSDLNLSVGIWFVESLPKLANWSKLFSPLLFVESKLLSTSCSQALKTHNDLVRVEPLNGSVDVAWQSKDIRIVNIWHLHDRVVELLNITSTWHLDKTRKWCFSTNCLLTEDSLHVGPQHTHIKLIINTSSINSILQDTIHLLPSNIVSFHFLDNTVNNLFTSHEITIGELVVFDPTLWDVCSSLLQQGVEP